MGIKNVLKFKKTLGKGEIQTIKFIERSPQPIDINGKAVAVEIARSFPIPTFRYNLEIIFIGQKPKTICNYNMLSLLERPGFPDEVNQIDFIKNRNSIKKSFNHLHAGMYSGIAWIW